MYARRYPVPSVRERLLESVPVGAGKGQLGDPGHKAAVLFAVADVPEREQLMEELLDYRMKISLQTGHDSYQPWREGGHDDLLFALCLATWASGYTKRSHPSEAIEGG